MIGQATDGGLLEVVMLIVQIATPAALGLVAWMGKRLVAQNDRKIELLCRRLDGIEEQGRTTDKTSVVSDQIIRTELARHYVDKQDHTACRAASRETEVRVFEKIEALKTQVGEVTGEMRGLRTAIEGLTRGIGGLLRTD
jgi:hypothetical protein